MRFDPVRLEVLGDPVTVVDHVMMKPTGAANYAVSRQGTLVYVPGGVSEQTPLRSLVWVDRKGHEEPIKAPLRAYGLAAHVARRHARGDRHSTIRRTLTSGSGISRGRR